MYVLTIIGYYINGTVFKVITFILLLQIFYKVLAIILIAHLHKHQLFMILSQ